MKNTTVIQEDTVQSDIIPPLLAMSAGQLVRIIAWGAVIGLMVWGLSMLLDMYVFKTLICKGVCPSGTLYAEAAASILLSGLGLFGLVKLQMFRPLLIALGALISLWGLVTVFGSLPWYGTMLLSGAAYGMAYGTFAWITRVRSFWTVLVILVVIVVAVRLAINS